MRKLAFGCVALLAMAACDGKPLKGGWNPDDYQRAYAATQDQPFDTGAISVVTEEHGEMHTYTLRPCRNNTHICGARAGHIVPDPDFIIVRGAFHGRDFYLSPGGDGWLKRGDKVTPLAWN